jgi:hypothetical protein
VALQALHQLGHGLLGHAGTLGQGADGGAGVVEVLEHGAGCRSYWRVAVLGKAGDDQAVQE